MKLLEWLTDEWPISLGIVILLGSGLVTGIVQIIKAWHGCS